MLARVRFWWRYRRALGALADEYLGAGWRVSPQAWQRLQRQARKAAMRG